MLLLENFRNSDRTPPYIDAYLQIFPNFGNYGKSSPIRMSLRPTSRVYSDVDPGLACPTAAAISIDALGRDRSYAVRRGTVPYS